MVSEHLLFSYHWLKKVENDQWSTLASHLGTVWDIAELNRLKNNEPVANAPRATTVFVPLSLVMNPGLVEGLLNKGSTSKSGQPLLTGDGLSTEMALPGDVVPMSTLSKTDFLKMIRCADYSVLG